MLGYEHIPEGILSEGQVALELHKQQGSRAQLSAYDQVYECIRPHNNNNKNTHERHISGGIQTGGWSICTAVGAVIQPTKRLSC